MDDVPHDQNRHYEIDAVSDWQRAFDEAIDLASKGLFEKEIVEAKKIFFLRLGASHEMKADVFEAASRSFLEWYLFDYPTQQFGKTPIVTLMILKALTGEAAAVLESALHNRWSLYHIEKKMKQHIILEDLLVGVKRVLWLDRQSVDAKMWRLECGQLVQARLFPVVRPAMSAAAPPKTRSKLVPHYFMSHPWIHPASEKDLLFTLCDQLKKSWVYPQEFLIDCFETAVRSHNIQGQVRVAKRQNWYYQELKKRYAPTK